MNHSKQTNGTTNSLNSALRPCFSLHHSAHVANGLEQSIMTIAKDSFVPLSHALHYFCQVSMQLQAHNWSIFNQDLLQPCAALLVYPQLGCSSQLVYPAHNIIDWSNTRLV